MSSSWLFLVPEEEPVRTMEMRRPAPQPRRAHPAEVDVDVIPDADERRCAPGHSEGGGWRTSRRDRSRQADDLHLDLAGARTGKSPDFHAKTQGRREDATGPEPESEECLF